jgi:hypothetical protein
MSSIDKLTRVKSTDLSGGDFLAIFNSALGSDAAVALNAFVTWIQSQLTTGDKPAAQFSAPNATGFSVAVAPITSGADTWLLLTPAAGYAAGTIVLPALPVDSQVVEVTCTQAVTALTVNGNGATAVYGAPTTLAANAVFRLRFSAVTTSWYLIP